MTVAVDAMGGDKAPLEIVKGAAMASQTTKDKILLVGNENVISNILSGLEYNKDKLEIVHASEVITNEDKPTVAIRKKTDSSLVKCFSLLVDGSADAMVSAGSTGALLAGSIHFLKRIKGIKRPALVPYVPNDKNGFILVDGGANTNSRPENLLQFAIMGSVYAEKVLKVKHPKVGLLNIGSEELKGNELVRNTFNLLVDSGLNFVGNIEAREAMLGEVDVVVCDGFAGNILLKAVEGTGLILFKNLKEILTSGTLSKIAALLLKKGLYSLKKKYDYKEHGGAPFLGVSSCVVKAHGASDAKSVAYAIKQASDIAASGAIEAIAGQIKVSETES